MDLGRQIDGVTVIERLGGSASADVYRGRDEAGRVVAIKVFRVSTADVGKPRPLLRLLSEDRPNARRLRGPAATRSPDPGASSWSGSTAGAWNADWNRPGSCHWPKPSDSARTSDQPGRTRIVMASCTGTSSRPTCSSVAPATTCWLISVLWDGCKGKTSMTMAGEIAGTPRYVSPEQIEGLPQTPASDIFGLGLLLYRSVCGDLPGGSAT